MGFDYSVQVILPALLLPLAIFLMIAGGRKIFSALSLPVLFVGLFAFQWLILDAALAWESNIGELGGEYFVALPSFFFGAFQLLLPAIKPELLKGVLLQRKPTLGKNNSKRQTKIAYAKEIIVIAALRQMCVSPYALGP